VDGYSRLTEIEAYAPVPASSANVQWLISDHLGTPRMLFDQTGDLANVKRHDYLPFGEELIAPISGRTTAQGYAGDGVRQQFTSHEREMKPGWILRRLATTEARKDVSPQLTHTPLS
jgi:hypothetical protein